MTGLGGSVERSIALREAGDSKQASEMLRSALGQFAPRLALEYRQGLVEAVDFATSHRDAFRDASVAIVDETRAVDPLSAGQWAWLTAHYVLAAHGFFEASGIARDNARKAALFAATTLRGRGDVNFILLALRASLDMADLGRARSLRARLGDRPELSEIDVYLRLCAGSRCGDTERSLPAGDGPAKRFRESICQHTVAVVGPAPSGSDQGDEIDGFDVVCRINYWGADHLPPSRESGCRTDVAYYNNAIGCRTADGGRAGFLGDLRFSVFKNAEHVGDERSSRGAHRPDLVYFSGHPNMIPIVVFDVLHFDPAGLKVFGASFFLSERTHHESYIGCPKVGRIAPRSLASHDMESQVNFVRNLARAGVVEMDELGAGVLAMSAADYLRTMESYYCAV